MLECLIINVKRRLKDHMVGLEPKGTAGGLSRVSAKYPLTRTRRKLVGRTDRAAIQD